MKTQELEARWKEVELALSAELVNNPEKAEFAADLGLWMRKSGMPMDGTQHFLPMGIHDISMFSLGNYTSFSVFDNEGDHKIGTSIDYTQDQLEQILNIISEEKREAIKEALSKQPYMVTLSSPIQVVMETRMGELQHGQYEDFIPLIVTKIDVNYSKKIQELFEKFGTLNEWEIDQAD